MRIGSLELAGGQPVIMGIVNATPDSFSDGGRFLEPPAAIDHALALEGQGAKIIDVGGESTRPGSTEVSEDEELSRVIPIVEGIRRHSLVPISIDTTKSGVARAALDAGADMINDISAGRFDADMLPLAAERGVSIVLMHMRGTPGTMQDKPLYDDIMGEIMAFLADAISRAEKAGISRDRIAIDPGIGFGKTVEGNITILKRLVEFKKLDAPILIGTSRKAFIGKVLELKANQRLEGTLACLAIAIQGGASILRVHDVEAARRFCDMYLALRR